MYFQTFIEILIIISGANLIRGNSEFIDCNFQNPYLWHLRNTYGNVFNMLHLIVIFISCIQAERAFYSSLKKLNYFEKQLDKRSSCAHLGTTQSETLYS